MMIFPSHSTLMYTLFGIATFMYGMSLASQSLQKLTSNKIRDLLVKISDKPYLGVVVGIIITVLIQSSGAVTTMLVGLGSAGVITLSQVMSLLLGTAIGTTFTVQLLSFKVAQWGIPLFTFAFIVYFITSKKTLKIIMSALMGFGLIFWGLEVIGMGTQDLRNSEAFVDFLATLKAHPFYTVLATAFFTALVHSSAVTIGFAMTLAQSQMIDLEQALFWVYGANIGTTATALMASIGSNFVGKQVAWAHTLFKVTSVILFFSLTPHFAQLIHSPDPARDVANAHTLFNLLSAFVFYFFIKQGAQLVEKLFPPSDTDKDFSVKFLNRRDYQNVSVAVAHAERELMRMGDICYSMVSESLKLFRSENEDLEEEIQEKDNRVDLLNKEICLYLAEIMDEGDAHQQKLMMRMMSFATDLESVGDVVEKNLMDLARKKHALKLDFNELAWKEVSSIHLKCIELASLTLTCFQRQDSELAAKVVYLKRDIRTEEKKIRASHLERMAQGNPNTIKTSSIFLDTLGEYRRISGLLSNHAYSFLKDHDKYKIYPRREPT